MFRGWTQPTAESQNRARVRGVGGAAPAQKGEAFTPSSEAGEEDRTKSQAEGPLPLVLRFLHPLQNPDRS